MPLTEKLIKNTVCFKIGFDWRCFRINAVDYNSYKNINFK